MHVLPFQVRCARQTDHERCAEKRRQQRDQPIERGAFLWISLLLTILKRCACILLCSHRDQYIKKADLNFQGKQIEVEFFCFRSSRSSERANRSTKMFNSGYFSLLLSSDFLFLSLFTLFSTDYPRHLRGILKYLLHLMQFFENLFFSEEHYPGIFEIIHNELCEKLIL